MDKLANFKAAPFYADIERIESNNKESKDIDSIGALIPDFPTVGSGMFAYLPGGERYVRTSRVESVMIFDDYVRVQTKHSVYVLRNLKPHT